MKNRIKREKPRRVPFRLHLDTPFENPGENAQTVRYTDWELSTEIGAESINVKVIILQVEPYRMRAGGRQNPEEH